jgi:hypothetical protein
VSKKLIIVLVAIVVLFVVTIAIGASHGSSASPAHPGFAGALKGLQGSRFLTIGDAATTTCAIVGSAPTVLSVSGSCVISVEKRGLFSSATRVAFDANGQVGVVAETKSVPAQTNTVDGGECYGSAIDHSGGTITLSAFPATTITLRTAACPDDAGA